MDATSADVTNKPVPAPTAANINVARKAFESMDYDKQQAFITKNPQFNIEQYGFKMKDKIQPE